MGWASHRHLPLLQRDGQTIAYHQVGGFVRVYKYPLALSQRAQEIEMPRASRVVHVATQMIGGQEVPVLWARVSPTEAPVIRRFAIFATGEDIAPRWDYIGTVHIGWTVWHIHEWDAAEEASTSTRDGAS